MNIDMSQGGTLATCVNTDEHSNIESIYLVSKTNIITLVYPIFILAQIEKNKITLHFHSDEQVINIKLVIKGEENVLISLLEHLITFTKTKKFGNIVKRKEHKNNFEFQEISKAFKDEKLNDMFNI